MKKFSVFCLMLIFISACTTACTTSKSKKPNMVQSKRRFANYMEGSQVKTSGAIDLSEGPKLKYDKKLGPQNLEFDIKIVDPYQY